MMSLPRQIDERFALLLATLVIAMGLILPGAAASLMEAPLRLVISMASQSGWPLEWTDGSIRIGSVQVPWSEDCSGIPYFVALPAMAAFAAWSGGLRCSITAVVIIPVLLAVMVNAARVASILAYRIAFAPREESEQLHYLLGFIWLVPALLLLLPKETRATQWLPCLHLSAVLGLLSPHLSSPGGAWLLIATTFVALKQVTTSRQNAVWWQWALWSLVALWISLSQMESLWLPWLLSCPWRGTNWLRGPESIVALGCTVPLVAMQPWTPVLLAAVLLMMSLRWWRQRDCRLALSSEPSNIRRLALSAVFLVPYISHAFVQGSSASILAPPASLQATGTSPNCYELHLNGQLPGMRADWIASQGGGRHHTLRVCMAYRGEHLTEAQKEGPVFTDGSVLRREFFLFPDALVNDYASYLRHTFWPGSDTGVHLILSASTSAFTAPDFESECRSLVARIREHCRPTSECHQP